MLLESSIFNQWMKENKVWYWKCSKKANAPKEENKKQKREKGWHLRARTSSNKSVPCTKAWTKPVQKGPYPSKRRWSLFIYPIKSTKLSSQKCKERSLLFLKKKEQYTKNSVFCECWKIFELNSPHCVMI